MVKRKPVTVSLKADLFNKYRKYCDDNGMLISRRVEVLLEQDLKEKGKRTEFIRILEYIKKVNNNKCKLVEVALDTQIRLLKQEVNSINSPSLLKNNTKEDGFPPITLVMGIQPTFL